VKVYIAGPMTGLPEFNFPAFFRVAEIVRQQGHEAINPAEAAPPDMPWAWYMRRALRLLLDADEVWMLPGWEHSPGARMEFHVASGLGMPIRCLSVEEGDTDG